MATIGEMVSTLAHAIGMPEESVAQVSRILRDAGMIKSGGRGRSAAKMTADDCANLLIAVMIADQAKKSPEYVKISHSLTRVHPSNDTVEIGDTFSSAIANLLRMISENKIQEYYNICDDDLDISVSANRPLTHGHISVGSGRMSGIKRTVIYRSYYINNSDLMGDGDPISILRFNPPLRIEATVNEIVVLSLSDLLKT